MSLFSLSPLRRGFSSLLTCAATLLIGVTVCFSLANATHSQEVRVGLFENKPMCYTDDQGEPAGIFVSVIEYVAAREGWQLVYVKDGWSALRGRLEKGEIDVLMSVGVSEEREKIYKFNDVDVFTNWAEVYVKPASEIKSLLDLKGKSVATLDQDIYTTGPAGMMKINDNFNLDISFLKVNEYKAVLQAVKDEVVDAGVVNRLVGSMYEEELGLTGTGIVFSPVRVRFALNRESAGTPAIIKALDRDLVELRRDNSSIYHQAISAALGGDSTTPVIPRWVVVILITGGSLLLGALGLVFFFRWQLKIKTADLKDTNNQLYDEMLKLNEVESSLRESEEKFRAIFENSPLGHGHFNRDGIITTCNDNLALILGSSLENLTGQDRMAVINDQKMKAALSAALAGEKSHYTGDYFSVTGQVTIPLEAHFAPMLSPEGAVDGAIGIFEDITRRKVAEQELTKWQRIFEITQWGVSLGSADGERFELMNPAYARMHGYTVDELLKKEISAVFTPEFRKKLPVIIQKCHDMGHYSFEGDHLRKDGTTFPAYHDVTTVEDENGHPLYRIVGLLDISATKAAELEIMGQKKFIQSAIDALNDTFFVLDPVAGKPLLWNKAFKRISGYSDEEISSMPAPESYYSEEDMIKAGQYIKEILSGTVGTIELELICKDGRRIATEYSSSVIKGADGQVEALISIGRDITMRKQMEDALQESKDRFMMMMQQSPSVVELYDADGLQIEVNNAYEKLWGFAASQTVNKFNVLKSKEVEETGLMEYVKRAYDGEVVKVPEYEFDPRGETEAKGPGRPRWLSTRIYPLKNRAGMVDNIVITHEDISEVKYAEIETKKLEAELRQALKMEAIGTLAGGIAHDFNNILAAIIGYAEMVRDEVPDASPAQRDIGEVLKAGKRAKELVQHILSFSRKSEEDRVPVAIHLVAGETLTLLRASIPTTIEIRQDIDDKCGTILANPTQIHQVIMNLCTNAAQAMDEKGGIMTVTLSCSEFSAEDLVKEPAMAPGPYVKLTVSDNGPGIDRDHIARIFDPYFTTKGVGKGSGMGLAVVQGIVKGHDGLITLDSTLGKGTTFNVFFPIIKDVVQPEIEKKSSLPTGKERVLVVDDELNVVEMTRRRLEKLGYQVTAVTDSMKALELFRARPDGFDLVISDQTMPRLTGEKLARKILEIRSDMPIIICTGFSSKIDAKKADFLGIRAFLMKPVAKEELATTIRRVLDTRR